MFLRSSSVRTTLAETISSQTMKFHHLVEINTPLNPLIDTLSRAQVWRGLVLRAEEPGLFMPHLDRCDLSGRTESSVARTLQFGALNVIDTVYYFPQERIEYRVPRQGEIPASTLTMSIEEPQEGVLSVRFDYDDGSAVQPGSMEAFYDEFRRSAYLEADLDTISLIRQLAQEGRLDQDAAAQ